MKSTVLLVAFGATKDLPVEQLSMTTEEYYEGGIPLIDAREYRSKRGIVLVRGEIFDSRGRAAQRFENRYASDGRLSSNRTVHGDGSVTEQIIDPIK